MNYKISGIPANFSVSAAMSAGLLPANTLVVSGFGTTPQPIEKLLSSGVLTPSVLASTLTFASPPTFGGAN